MTKAKFLFSGTGLLSVAVSLLIAVGLISAFPSVRIDLTGGRVVLACRWHPQYRLWS